MSFFVKIVIKFLSNHSIPVFKSFVKAYKETTAGQRHTFNQDKRYTMDGMFNSILTKANIVAPPLDRQTALQILEIDCKGK
jgi:hypothetical protein